MEVLNRNQRRSAKWRLFFLGVIILGIVSAAMASMHNAYSSSGADDLEKCRKELAEKEQYWKGKNQDLVNKNKQLQKQLKAHTSKGNKPNEEVIHLKRKMDIQDQKIDLLKTQLVTCKSQLTQ